jgi:Holliday junction DNA helicase RuvA
MIALLRGRVLEKHPNRVIVDVGGVGYGTVLELSVFERLIAVSGIGPKLALAVLSGLEPRDLVSAIQRGDVARLTAIPGVGKKTAERIVVELRDRLPKTLDAAASVVPPSPGDLMRDDLVSALGNLGYHRQAIDRALDKLLATTEAQPFEAMLRSALKELSRV